MSVSRWVIFVAVRCAVAAHAMIAILLSAAALNIEPTVLTAEQIKHIVTGTTLAGNASEGPIRIFFDINGNFVLTLRMRQNPARNLSGTWYVEPEADLLCLSVAPGDGGRQCWIVRRGDVIELISLNGSLAPLNVPLRTVNFSVQDTGKKMELIEWLFAFFSG